MPITRCPECGAQVRVEDPDLGYDVECPTCRAVFRAGGAAAPRRGDDPDETFPLRDDPADRPSRRRPADDEDDDDDRPRRRGRRRRDDDLDDEEVVEEARRAIHLPALLSMIVAILAILYQLADTAFVLLNPQALQGNPFMAPGGQPPPMEAIIGIKVFAISWCALTLVGTISMLRMKSHSFAMAAMVLQMVPCSGPCCLVGLPLGIWGLVSLNRPDVSDGFKLAARGVQPRERDDDFDDDR
jgi:predicted Zn finger-like uncharacterized protein